MKRFWVLALAVVVVLAGGGFLYVRAERARTAQGAPEFDTAQATYGPIDVTVTGTGSVQPAGIRHVTSAVAARVATVAVAVGDRVAAGSPLVELQDDGTLATRVDQAKAQLAADLAQLDSLLHPTPAKDSDIAAAQAKVAVDEERIAQDQRNLEALAVEAPFDGVVQAVSVREGDAVTQGTPLLTVADTSAAYIDVSVSQLDLTRIHAGDRATVTIPGYASGGPGGPGALDAEVVALPTLAEAGSGGTSGRGGPTAPTATFTVTVAVSNPPADLVAGLGTAVTILPDDGKPPITSGGQLRYETRDLAAGVAGTVKELAAKAGDSVTAGQVLVRLDNPSFATQLATDEAALAQDRAALDALLHPEPPADETVASLQARVAQDRLDLQAAQRDLASLSVTSPVAGVVASVSVAPGDEVAPGQELVQVVDESQLTADVAVDELDIADVKPGQSVTVTADALPGLVFTGRVETVAPVANQAQGVATFDVTIAVTGGGPAAIGRASSRAAEGGAAPPSEAAGGGAPAGGAASAGEAALGRLKPGMSVTATIAIAHKDRALLVPAEAVVAEGSRGTVRVLRDGQPEIVPVEVGLTNGTVTEILSGLEEGDTVITATAQGAQTNFRFGGPFGVPGEFERRGAGGRSAPAPAPGGRGQEQQPQPSSGGGR